MILILLAMAVSQIDSNADHERVVLGQGDYVVLLHGMGRTTRSMQKMEKHFLTHGFRVVNLAYPSTRKPIETLATEYLGAALVAQCHQPDRKIHFVTHSLGGIVLAYYLQNHALPNLGRVVMLAPPMQGSELTDRWHRHALYQFIIGPAGQQLGTAPSSFPNKLGPAKFELGVIAGNRTINPWTSHIIPGDDDGKVAVVRAKAAGMQDFIVVPRTHTFIMRDRGVINQALCFIRTGLFNKDIAAGSLLTGGLF